MSVTLIFYYVAIGIYKW